MFLQHKGMTYVTWEKDRFLSNYSDESLVKLESIGVDHLSICVTLYQEKYNSTKIEATNQTPSDKSIKHVIKRAHDLGMKVLLKPHIDLLDKYDGTYWRADIGFASSKDWEKWFGEYKKMILHYAELAEKNNVEIFCIGTELSFTTTKEDNWREIISEVRNIFSGKITYAANWDNFKSVKFWDALDFVGIDAYFPISYASNPSFEELKQGWKKWEYEINEWQKEIGLPILFTEIGYASTEHAPYTPWKGGEYGNPNMEIQANCYKAFFETIWKNDWFLGAYWWKWDTNTNAGGSHNRQFTPQNKPAQMIIAKHYKEQVNDYTYAMAK